MSEHCRADRRASFRHSAVRRIAATVLLAVAPPVAASAPWAESFEADAAAMLAAAAAFPEHEDGVDFLFSENEIRLESDLRQTNRFREVYRLTKPAALDDWSTVWVLWSPWHQHRPEVRARVIAADGTEHRLDPATLSEQPVAAPEATQFTDRRLLNGPLPGIGVGSLVLVETVVRDEAPVFPAGLAGRFPFGADRPLAAERFVLDVPADLPLRHESLLVDLPPHREEADGRVRWTWEVGPLEARVWPDDVPGDVPVVASVAYAAGGSWQEVAAAYSRWVDERIAGWSMPEEIEREIAAAGGRRAKAAAALAWLHREVRYVALALGDAGLVPRAPAETLARKYGDCKDKSTLLVAMLRQAGIEAEVALLDTGPGLDVDPDLPGLGLFDHAIVHLPADRDSGEPELWIDATVPEARVGQLPAGVRARRALLVRPAGGELRTTPSAVSADHGVRFELVVTLADWGAGTETIEEQYRGDFELGKRHHLPALLSDEESGYAGAEVVEPPADGLGRPLIVRLVPRTGQVGLTQLDWAEYGFSPQYLVADLPASLSPEAREEDRRFDLEMATPFVKEVRLRVIPPAGFDPFDLPEDEERTVGVARYERRLDVLEDGAVEIFLRFDSGPARMTPEEVEATREALAELGLEETMSVRFRSRGSLLLEEGRVAEAVRELRSVAEAETRPSHRARLAHAFLAAGLGESAEREARSAVELDPESGLGHQTLGMVLAHDRLGRLLRAGFDAEGAEAALRRALEIDSEDLDSRLFLTLLLEHGEGGIRYAPDARLDEAIEQYRLMRDELGVREYDQGLLNALWIAGRFDEVAALAPEATAVQARSHLLAAIAVRRGVQAALSEATRSANAATRRRELDEASGLLLQVRLYGPAAEMTTATAQGAPDTAERLSQAALLRRVVRHESVEADPNDPRWAVFRLVRAVTLANQDGIEEAREEARQVGGIDREDFDVLVERLAETRRKLYASTLMAPDVALDFWNAAALEVERSGSPGTGYRLKIEYREGRRETWYVAVGDDGRLAVVAHNRSDRAAAAGRQALRHLEAGRTEAARQWLDWAREAVSTAQADDPWSGHPFAVLWRAGDEADGPKIRRAALSLLLGAPQAAEVVDELVRLRAAAADTEEGRALEIAVASAYHNLERWDEVVPLVRGWFEATPRSDQAYTLLHSALRRLDDTEGLVRIADQRLAARPDDPMALRTLRWLAAQSGDLTSCRRHAQRVVDSGGHAGDISLLARLALLDGSLGEAALELAHRAVQSAGESPRQRGALRALATLLAELDRPLEARAVVLQALDVEPAREPGDGDWYVFGRIAESYGEDEVARAAYGRIEAPVRPDPFDVWHLAQRRLSALAVLPSGETTTTGPVR